MHEIIPIKLSSSYKIYIEPGLILECRQHNYFSSYLSSPAQSLVLVTDSNLGNYAKDLELLFNSQGHEVLSLQIPAGEASKTRETKQWLEDQMLQRGLGKSTKIMALGGGVISDLVGFVAATYARGIDVYYLPTTLLAMVDASIGGKTAVNTPWAKNAIGCIVQPKAVFIDPLFLASLPKDCWLEGWVEMIKHALISDVDWYTEIEQNKLDWFDIEDVTSALIKSCHVKKYWVEQDEYDQNARQVLNLGHTFAHAIEQVSHYTISHGCAVAMGLVIELYLSTLLYGLDNTIWERVFNLFQKMGIVFQHELFKEEELLMRALSLDKKNHSKQVYMIGLSSIGNPVHINQRYANPVSHVLLNRALNFAQEQFLKSS